MMPPAGNWPRMPINGSGRRAARVTTPADWHVTLHFIGDVATEQIEAIAACAAVPLQPFDLVLDQPQAVAARPGGAVCVKNTRGAARLACAARAGVARA